MGARLACLALLLGAAEGYRPASPSPRTLTASDSLAASDLDPSNECYSEANPNPLNFSALCGLDGGVGCWPALYLLGVQKAGTTSIADKLVQCSTAAVGFPTDETQLVSFECEGRYLPCKETMHATAEDVRLNSVRQDKMLDPDVVFFEALKTKQGRGNFTNLYNPNSCGRMTESEAAQDEEDSSLAKSLSSMSYACKERRFLSATPMDADLTANHLLPAMPFNVIQMARFVVILREPVSRQLSWYNHLLKENTLMNKPGKMSSFSTFAKGVQWPFDYGKYWHYLELFHTHNSLKRSQLLVLSFDRLLDDPQSTFEQITTHFGVPILRSSTLLPSDNDQTDDAKVVSILCGTRDWLNGQYKWHNDRLFSLLEDDHAKGRAPPVEPTFQKFSIENSVHCNTGKELTIADMKKGEQDSTFDQDVLDAKRGVKTRESSSLAASTKSFAVWLSIWRRMEALAGDS